VNVSEPENRSVSRPFGEKEVDGKLIDHFVLVGRFVHIALPALTAMNVGARMSHAVSPAPSR
jgi:hypothetical protein